MVRIYDCSNSSERPRHRGFGGAKENGVVTLLKKYSESFDFQFVTDPSEAQLLFTNDVFPRALAELPLLKVKRMDGIFWREQDKDRNESLNAAAVLADHVIFVSKYSRDSYHALYGQLLKAESVVLNWADSRVFYPDLNKEVPRKLKVLAAAATSWVREEKRLPALVALAEAIDSIKILMVGELLEPYPANMIPLGTLNHPELASTLRLVDAFVNFSYKDPAPKTIAESTCSGLPILYADSGGVSEMVRHGVAIEDPETFAFGTEVPSLLPSLVEDRFNLFCQQFEDLSSRARLVAGSWTTHQMLDGYFSVFRRVLFEDRSLLAAPPQGL